MDTPINKMIEFALVPIANPEVGDGSMPYATHSGVLNLFGKDMRVYRLNTGQAIIDSEDFEALWAEFLGNEA